MMKPYLLKTQNYELVPSVREDVVDIFRISHKYPNMTKFMLWDPARDISETYEHFDKNIGENYDFSIKKSGKFIGKIVIRPLTLALHEIKTVDLGYWVSPEFHNQGVMSEILPVIIKFSFKILKTQKLKAGAMGPNKASQKVLEKSGFRKIGVEKKRFLRHGKLYDDHLYEFLAEDYFSGKNFWKENKLETWGEQKRLISYIKYNKQYKEGEIWWINFGENLGIEQNGKGLSFRRPVLILKRYNYRHCVVLPLTTQKTSAKFSFYLDNKFLTKNSWVIFSQIKTLDSTRLNKKLGKLPSKIFIDIKKEAMKTLFSLPPDNSSPIS